MKNMTTVLTVSLALCGALVSAQEGVKDPPKVEARTPTEKIKTDFKVDDARVQSLRDKKYGYGEITKVLSLAEQMPGGITDENVAKITTMRDGPPKMGWGQIAKEQGVKLGRVTGKGVEASGEKHEKHEKHEKAEKAARPEKSERAEKPEKPARPEKAHQH